MAVGLALRELECHGLLLKSDPRLPSATSILAGERVRGSWWAHPMAHMIFRALAELAAHPDVLLAKLVSGKDTFVHRRFWPEIFAIGSAREPWQTAGLSTLARSLLVRVTRQGELQASGEPARELEQKLLVHGSDIHTESGRHARRLETWERWAARSGFSAPATSAAEARIALEEALEMLNRQFGGKGALPWRSSS